LGLIKIFRGLSWKSRIAALLGFGALAFASIYSLTKGFEWQITIQDPHSIDNSAPDDIWFSPTGNLIEVGHTGKKVWMKQWVSEKIGRTPSESSPLDLTQKVNAELQYSLRANNKNKVSWIPYAASSDAKKLAWAWNGMLYISDTNSGTATSIKLDSIRPIDALSFFSNSRVGVLYVDGKLEFWEDSGHKYRAGSIFDGRPSVWGRDSRIALSAFDTRTGDISTVDLTSLRMVITPQSGFLNGSAVGLSKMGRLAVGTTDGSIVCYELDRSVQIGMPGAIKALAFYNEEEILAGGDISSLVLVNFTSRKVTSLVPIVGVRLLALAKDHLAYATDGLVFSADLKRELSWSSTSGVVWKVSLAIISLLGFFLSILREQREQRSKVVKT